MKKLLLVSLLLLLLPCFTFGGSPPIATSKVKASKTGVKSIQQTPKGLGQKIALKAAMKITAITFKTNASGDWTFLYGSENIGFVTFAPHQLQFKSTQILKNGMRTPIHTVTYKASNSPGTKSSAHSPWDRCSNAAKLMLEIIYKGKVLDTKTVNVPLINVKITHLSSLSGKFKASLKNNTGYVAKVAVKTISKSPLQSGGSMNRVGAETLVIVPANSLKVCTGVIADKGQSTSLEALFKDEKKCSGKGYIVLDTKVFPAVKAKVQPKLHKDLPVGMQNGPLEVVPPVAEVQFINWSRQFKQWKASVKNTTNNIIHVGIAGWPMENGVSGMTIWTDTYIQPNASTLLIGDYSAYSVPVGTRLKVHVKLKNTNEVVHSKIKILN